MSEQSIFWVEYPQLHESRIQEVDAIIDHLEQKMVNDVDWASYPSITIGFNPDSVVTHIKIWGFMQCGTFNTITVNV